MDPVTLALSKRFTRKFGVESYDLFTVEGVLQGHTITAAGVVEANNAVAASTFIKVNGGTSYTATPFLATRAVWYDAAQEFISSSAPNSTGLVTAPASAEWVRLVMPAGNVGNIKFVPREQSVDAPRANQIRAVVPGHLVDDTGLNVGVDALAFAQRTGSLVGRDNLLPWHFLNHPDGTLSQNQSRCASELIPVKPNTVHVAGAATVLVEYDENGVMVGKTLTPATPFTTTERTRFVRLGGTMSDFDNIRLFEGTELRGPEQPLTVFNTNAGLARLNTWPAQFDMPIPTGAFSTSETFTGHPTWDATTPHSAVHALFDSLVNDFPSIVASDVIGQDAASNDIRAYHFTAPQPAGESQPYTPRIVILCGVHGGEKATPLSTYYAMRTMLEDWADYPHLEFLRHNVNITIVPVVNPSGWDLDTRKNANGVDLNRNNEYWWSGGADPSDEFYPGPEPLSEPETVAVNNLLASLRDIRVFVDFHNFGSIGNPDNPFLWTQAYTFEVYQLGLALNRRMTRVWRDKHAFVPPEPWFAGQTPWGPQYGTFGQAALRTHGIRWSGTLEMCNAWHLDPAGSLYDQTVIEAGVEELINYACMMLASAVG